MVEHRRTTSKPAFVPPGWIVLVAVLACIAGAGWLGVEMINPGSARADSPSASSSTDPTTSTPSATTPSPSETTPTTPTPTTESAPEEERSASVSVLNNTGIANLANTYADKVEAAGWTVGGVGNWRGQIESNTVYFPEGLEDQGRLLAQDLGIKRVLPSINPMRTDRLSIILSGPQQ